MRDLAVEHGQRASAEGDTEEIYPALLAALAGTGLAYLHVVYADPEDPVFQRIRKDWAGTLIANPVLPKDRVAGGRRHRARRAAAGRRSAT